MTSVQAQHSGAGAEPGQGPTLNPGDQTGECLVVLEREEDRMRRAIIVAATTATLLIPAVPAAAMPVPGEGGVAAVKKATDNGERPKRKPAAKPEANRWMDSGHSVWKDVPTWVRDFGLCVRRHESMQAGHYRAHNGSSSAAGAYQFLTGTWQGNARFTKLAKQWANSTADHAPPFAQDAVFIHAVLNGGAHAWVGTNCGHGT